MISPNIPIAVSSGGTYGFSASCGTGLTWQVIGPGTVNGSGVYSAPSSVTAQNQSRGCQELPNTHAINIPVNSLPVDKHSSWWLARVAEDNPQYGFYHNLKFASGQLNLFDNVVNNSAGQQLMHFSDAARSYGQQDTDFPIPPERTLMMEGGRSIDAYSNADRHMFTINNQTCQQTEIYNLYVDFRTASFTAGNPTQVTWTTNTIWPIQQNYGVVIFGATGSWSPANGNWRLTVTGQNSGTLPFNSSQWGAAPSGTILTSIGACNTCNSVGGQKFAPTSYAQLGGADAAGMPMSAASLKMDEWYAATQAGRTDLGHALRTTMSNRYLSSRFTWPGTSDAIAVDGTPIQLTAGTDSNPVTFMTGSDLSVAQPCDNYSYRTGCQFHVAISGFISGPWKNANGDWVATAVDNSHFTISLNTSSFGTMPSGAVVLFDFFPYGATIRLKSSFDLNTVCTSNDLSTWCPYAKVLLNTLKNYGVIVADGTIPSDNWDSGALSSEFHPNVLIDATRNLYFSTALQPIEQYLEVVNRSSQQLYSDLGRYGVSTVNRTQVCVNGSLGQACDDVILQGTTIGTDRERLTLAAGLSYPLNVWINGNVNPALSYSIDSGISGASVSSSGLLAMPNCTTKQRGMVTVTSAADPNALPLYIEVTCIPVSSDGAYRLAIGNWNGDYTDSSNHVWYGSWQNYGFSNNYEVPGLWWGTQTGTWQGIGGCSNDTWTGTDPQLYSRSTSFNEDTRVDLELPNGNYNVTLYGEPGFGGFHQNNTCGNTIGQNIFDWVVQGQTQGSWLDGYVLAGYQPYNGYTIPAATTVTDNTLVTIGRMRVLSIYGMSWSSLLIAPANINVTITTSSLPRGFTQVPYVAKLSATGGDPPYTWSLASGSGPLPPGLSLSSGGLISGRPTSPGTFPFTVQVTDSEMNTATKNLTIKICKSGSLC